MVSLLWCCERKRGITHTKRVSNEKSGPVPAVVVVAGTRAPLQVFEARRNGSRLRPAVRAGEGEPEGNDSSEAVATELRRPFPPKPPPPCSDRSRARARGSSGPFHYPSRPFRPAPPSRRGRGWGCRAARSPPKAAPCRLPHAQFVLFSLFLFFNLNPQGAPVVSSRLPSFVCTLPGQAPTAELIFSFFWFSTWKFRRELFRSKKTVTAPQTIAESENDRDRRRPGRDRLLLRRARAQLAEGRRRCTCARRRPTGEGTR